MKGNETITLMSFNVLNAWHPNAPVYRTLKTRSEGAAAFVLETKPDILCLQEFDYYYRNDSDFASRISEEYAEANTQGELAGKSWNPIFYRKERFRAVASGGYDFTANGFEAVTTKNSDPETYPPKACNEDPVYRYPVESAEYAAGVVQTRFRSLSWAVLESTDGKRLLTGNTHYSLRRWCHPAEMAFVSDVLASLQTTYACPALMCGDFNSTTEWGAANLMLSGGFFDTYDMAKEKDDVRSCHPTSGKGTEAETDVMPSGNYKPNAIDHIFATQWLAVERYRIFAEERLLSVSDHCPTMIKFDIS